jgi:hypothetical protein
MWQKLPLLLKHTKSCGYVLVCGRGINLSLSNSIGLCCARMNHHDHPNSHPNHNHHNHPNHTLRVARCERLFHVWAVDSVHFRMVHSLYLCPANRLFDVFVKGESNNRVTARLCVFSPHPLYVRDAHVPDRARTAFSVNPHIDTMSSSANTGRARSAGA